VCTAPVGDLDPDGWHGSVLRRRLARVLWMPILGEGEPGSRRVGAPVLWSPDPDQEATLAADYETLTELLAEGQVWQWHARHGVALQLRPKAASSKHRKWVLDEDAEWVQTVPLGFYLRSRFTASVLAGEARLIDP
jgi:DNA mismatch repair protein MutH